MGASRGGIRSSGDGSDGHLYSEPVMCEAHHLTPHLLYFCSSVFVFRPLGGWAGDNVPPGLVSVRRSTRSQGVTARLPREAMTPEASQGSMHPSSRVISGITAASSSASDVQGNGSSARPSNNGSESARDGFAHGQKPSSGNRPSITFQEYASGSESQDMVMKNLGEELFGGRVGFSEKLSRSGSLLRSEEEEELMRTMKEMEGLDVDRIDVKRQSNRVLNARPVSEDIFSAHTRCFGLLFKRFEIERIFLDNYARLCKRLVYLGYVLMILLGVFRFVQLTCIRRFGSYACAFQPNQGECLRAESIVSTDQKSAR